MVGTTDIDFERASSDLNDFLIPDENLLEILDIADDDELLKEFYDYENLLRCGTPLQRYTQDKSRPNKFGRRLLELCQNCSIYIANSRICKDKGIGKCTCKDSTVVDYLLISSSVFPLISEFEILDFKPLTSDVHNRIHMCLNSSRELENTVIHDEVQNMLKIILSGTNENRTTFYSWFWMTQRISLERS